MNSSRTWLTLALWMAGAWQGLACGRPDPRRHCFANQKIIAGAVEMYELDFNTRVEQLTPEMFRTLMSNGYLQNIPVDPGQGGQPGEGYLLLPRFRYRTLCMNHGAVHLPDQARAAGIQLHSPRDLMVFAGVTDPALLARARRCRVGDPGSWHGPADIGSWPRTALRSLVVALLPFQTQPLIWGLLRR